VCLMHHLIWYGKLAEAHIKKVTKFILLQEDNKTRY
jgi:hypothetical protein